MSRESVRTGVSRVSGDPLCDTHPTPREQEYDVYLCDSEGQRRTERGSLTATWGSTRKGRRGGWGPCVRKRLLLCTHPDVTTNTKNRRDYQQVPYSGRV